MASEKRSTARGPVQLHHLLLCPQRLHRDVEVREGGAIQGHAALDGLRAMDEVGNEASVVDVGRGEEHVKQFVKMPGAVSLKEGKEFADDATYFPFSVGSGGAGAAGKGEGVAARGVTLARCRDEQLAEPFDGLGLRSAETRREPALEHDVGDRRHASVADRSSPGWCRK